ncbi:MAG: SRPBCC family protein [Abditibacteriales bacterium]|nr:SRPBCC family protein [Abditibacteriales bacterium]
MDRFPAMPRLEFSVDVRAPLERVFAFHVDATNLLKITPPDAQMQIIGNTIVSPGAQIHLRVKIPFIGETDWVSCITEFKENETFTDEQVRGPLKRWKHTHIFQPIEGGTRITDIVEYEAPFGALGVLGDRLLGERQVRQMFEYRQRRTKELLESDA